MSKAELPPPPLGAELRAAEPWELCSTPSTKPASISTAMRRWGGGGTNVPDPPRRQ